MNIAKLDRTLGLVQQTSGLVFSSFTLLHLSGHLLAPLGFSLADSALYFSRVYYQNPLIEPLVIGGSLVVHIGSSVARIFLRQKRQQQQQEKKAVRNSQSLPSEPDDVTAEAVKDGEEEKSAAAATKAPSAAWPSRGAAVRELRLHRYAGWLLTPLVVGHVFATRIAPLLILPDPSIVDLTQITYALNSPNGLGWVYFAYFGVFGAAGLYHSAYGIQQALSALGLRGRRLKPGMWTRVAYACAAGMFMAVWAIGGGFEEVSVPLAAKWRELDEEMVGAALALFGVSWGSRSSAPTIGTKAPNFSAVAVSNGEFKTVSLNDFKGKYVVLFFYPMDFTFVCPTEIIAFSDAIDQFRKLNAEVVACSTDTQFSHLAWTQQPRKQGGLGEMKIPILADVTKKIASDYGVLIADGADAGVALRGTFIIDPEQNLRIAHVHDLPIGRNVAEYVRLLEALTFHAEHGEVCPANWSKGGKTIKADPTGSKEYFSQA
ncbi:hypothetical protein HDU87_008110 [Geranomyces variabilis]|uniref:thioredoxin-dependent peroxiredoxin n=1 Tax=Geranomyces variabilis TaxID=109894 RepID=A0AAD5TRD8_9FUNG|nr:hypothetical protein HDU87_008110 [Geranomyces variabilis]